MKKSLIPLCVMAMSSVSSIALSADSDLPAEVHENLARATGFAVQAEWAAQLRQGFLSVEGASLAAITDSISSEEKPGTNGRRMVKMVDVVNTFFDSDGAPDWNQTIADKLDALQLGDFFLGSQVWPGPFNEYSAVLGFYNPWWDALLVVKTTGFLPVQEDVSEAQMPKIERFAWVSGETLRGEPAEGIPSVQTVVPGELPLSVSLWRAQTGSLRRFDELCESCVPNDPDSFPWERIPSPKNSKRMKPEWDRIEARSAVRLNLYTLLADTNAPLRKAMALQCRSLLREGSRRRLRGYFTSPVHSFFVDSFVQLPSDKNVDLRKDFEIYGCVPADSGTLFYFVNAEVPRLYATVSIPRGIEDDPDAGNVVFEWYDLAKADSFLQAWEEEHAEADSGTRSTAAAPVKRDPDAALKFNQEGVEMVSGGEVSGGEAAFRRALEADPGCGEAARNLSKLLFAEGLFAEAHGILSRASSERPEDVSLLVPKAQAEALLDMDAAFAGSLEKISRHADSPELLSSLAVLLMGQESLPAAQQAAQAAARRSDADAETWFTLGLTEERLSHWSEAEAAYRTSLEKDDRFFRAWINLGNVRERQGDRSGAATCFERALALDEENVLAQYNLGRILALHTDRIDEGVDLLVKAANRPEAGEAGREARRLLEFVLSETR